MNILVLRPYHVPARLKEECLKLVNTRYLKGEYEKDLAPAWTDCLTAVAFIFRSKRWELDWIANMPRKLLSNYQFTVARNPIPGDLLFLANRKGITKHVAVFVSNCEVFHSSKQVGGGCIESINHLFERIYPMSKLPIYYQINDPLDLLTQIDPRTNYNPINIATFKKNKKAAKNCLTDPMMCQETNHTVFFINYSLVPQLSPMQTSFNPNGPDPDNIESLLSPNASSSMDCSITPPASPSIAPTGYSSSLSIPPLPLISHPKLIFDSND